MDEQLVTENVTVKEIGDISVDGKLLDPSMIITTEDNVISILINKRRLFRTLSLSDNIPSSINKILVNLVREHLSLEADKEDEMDKELRRRRIR